MPLFDYKCASCGFKKEHFVLSAKVTKTCPKCSGPYNLQMPNFKSKVAASNLEEIESKEIEPFVKEMHEKIGREAMDFDTKTLDDIYGAEKVSKTFYEKDD